MINILLLDTTALTSYFIQDDGTATMRWLVSPQNAAHNTTRYLINNKVIQGFEENLEQLVKNNVIKQITKNQITTLFNSHYKHKQFKLVGEDASVEDTLCGIYNFIGRITSPFLVTANIDLANKIKNHNFQCINPKSQTPQKIEQLLGVGSTTLQVANR